MKRVIDISEDAYELLLEKGTCGKFANLGEIVANSKPLEQEPTTKNDLTEQCIACKYDETEDENGEHCKKCLEGDSQFELDNEFVEPTTKNDLGVDAVSRQAVIDLMMQKWGENFSGDDAMQESIDAIRELPSVTPQDPKTGHWKGDNYNYMCDKCGHDMLEIAHSIDYISFKKPNYCPNCGCAMKGELE